jgi:hypothetical protein
MINQASSSQSISSEEFIIQALTEKVNSLQHLAPASSTLQTGLREKDGILVFDTDPLDHVDFNALIAQSREEYGLESVEQ